MLLALSSALCVGNLSAAPTERIKLKLAPMPGIGHLVPELANGLGFFKAEGLDVEFVNVMNFIPEDWVSTELLNNGTIDAEICWYQRTVFGIGNGYPATAVFLIEDTPHLTISVANRVKDEVHSAADFKGRVVADSAGFSTKRYLTDYVMERAGLKIEDYTPAPVDWSSQIKPLTQALNEGKVDVVASMEPYTTKVLATKMVTPMFDLTTAEGTRKAIGDVWLARCLYLSPAYIKAHPDTVQRLVNAFTRTMRFINSHTAEEIVAKLPRAYFAPDIKNDEWAEYKAEKIEEIAKVLPGMTHGNYSIPPSAANLACSVLFKTNFDDSGEGKYRLAAARSGKVKPEMTYDNRFVEKAMSQIP